ncbi:hypothetical protein D3C75_726490 [compost metagenome]
MNRNITNVQIRHIFWIGGYPYFTLSICNSYRNRIVIVIVRDIISPTSFNVPSVCNINYPSNPHSLPPIFIPVACIIECYICDCIRNFRICYYFDLPFIRTNLFDIRLFNLCIYCLTLFSQFPQHIIFGYSYWLIL